MDGKSLDILSDKITKLKEIIPEAFTEEKIDWEKLRAALGEDINFENERYNLSWAGKSDAFRVLQQRTSGTLIPLFGEGVNDVPAWGTHPPAPSLGKRRGEETETENIFIEGENLEVLKILQKSYFGKIKMIYIDPPYNTGSDSFIYPDKFSETKDEYLKRIGDKDEEGFLLKEGFFRKNSKESGHYHSNWLSMMYPRLYTARNLLRDDGVIFVSIDDNEVHNLRMIMNEIFGEENFFTQIIVRTNSRGQTYKQIAKTHEYIIVYTKNTDVDLNELEKDELSNDLNLNDDISSYNIRELRNRNPKFGRNNRPNLYYPIYVNSHVVDKDNFSPISLKKTNEFNIEILPLNSTGGESCWRWGQTKVILNANTNTLKSNLVAKKKSSNSFGIYEKYRKTTYKPKSIWVDNSFLTESGTVELREIGLEQFFEFPKPTNLIRQCIQLATLDDDIILDFFAGSGTTAQAVMELNKEDGGNRKFILAQLPEKTDENSEAYKAKYFTIADICKERIRRVINRLNLDSAGLKDEQDESQKNLFNNPGNPKIMNNQGSDNGFKVFKLMPSNFKMWRSDVIETEEDLNKMVDLFDTQIKPDAKKENMLYELMLKSGFTLTDKIEKINGYYSVNDGNAVFVLDKIDQNIIDAIIKLKPQSCIILDDLFAGNDQLKTNTALQMKDAGVELSTV